MGDAAKAKIPSESSHLDQLVMAYDGDTELRNRLRLEGDWPRRWSATWRVSAGEVCWPIRDMAHVPVLSSRPMRGFTWRAKQRHRPGLEVMAATGWTHGFESLEELRLLVALDFLRASEVLSQPFRVDFEHRDGKSWHIPDYLAVISGGMWLLDVRPMDLIADEDALKFAAAREVAAACGWRYSVVAGWRPHVWSVLDHLSSRRRPTRDLLGMRDQLLTAIGDRAGRVMTFSELADATSVPAVGRANIVRLLWQRELGVDLGSPLRDSSLVWGV
ncbi:TnsA-like heteromeric transposase endonuclease subunit [Streptomyces sp. NPDC048416]|uniref:TnsA-like heteromeric transposase endonuclease subunit n=1 Tax=Streptomyces sp. NPDC048416 TaxID=3365546 RepID=UPI00372397D9